MKEGLLQSLDLSTGEQLALAHLLDRLRREYDQIVLQVLLYGSIARDERRSDSDVDVLIITRHDD